ncbi:DNA-binding proteins Bright/BRCAA1/RBP1 and proteins containing BRIGHT domain, partial [Peltigera leucophlebia]|nr:DNA-binding proteins Bright/BRCAA1/RBP1 and proteins containing BRIGHT domain [Peltigera leucophlebia]
MAAGCKNTSNIAIELAGMMASVNIPKSKHRDSAFWDGRESFAAVAAKSLNGSNKHQSGLPTPPNSFSPVLVPQGFKGRAAKAALAPPTPPAAAHVDSDIDLQEAVDHANAQDKPQHALSAARGLDGLADMDAAGVITPGLLAKHHLPGILLDHGPLAIRHVMGFLTTSVPGFSGIPPAKARRLVVGALEGRGSSGEHGGLHGDVIFEKVGWGRWDARRRGEVSRESRSRQQNENLRPAGHTSSQPQGLQIPTHSARLDRSRKNGYGTSITGESAMFSHDSEMEYDQPDEHFSMLEQEADK